MKILMIAPTPFFSDRGCHIRIYEETKALKKLGHSVVLVTYHIGDTPKGIDARRIINIPFYHRTAIGSSGKFPFDPKYILDFFLLLKSLAVFIKEKPDIIHAHLHEGAIAGWLVKKLAFSSVPVVFDCQGTLTGELSSYGFLGQESFVGKLFASVERFILGRMDYIFVSSEALFGVFRENFGFLRDKMGIVEDGVGSHVLRAGLSGKEPRKKLNIPGSVKVAIYTGSLSKDKGIDYLFEAMPQICGESESVLFLICGYPNVEFYKRRAEELGIAERVIFTGRLSYFDLPSHLEMADIAIDPKPSGTGEAAGKIKNYMGAGLPVICFDTINNRAILGKHGIYAKDKDTNDLTRKITWAIGNPRKAAAYGKALKKRVRERFTWDLAAKKLDKIYIGLLE